MARFRRAAALMIVAVTVAAGACSDDGGDGNGDVGGSASSTSQSTPSTTAPGGSPQDNAISVTMKDFSFDPSSLSSKGAAVAVSLTNTGNASHTFTIDDPKIDTAVPAGSTGQVLVSLAGKTEVVFYCRFHRGSGMQGKLTVGS